MSLSSSVMCHRHTPSSKRNLSSKIFAESAATYFLPLTKWFRLLFSAGQILPSLHMPAEITARSKVDISRVARLFDTFRPYTAVADNTLIIKQKSTLPVSKTRQDKSLFRSLSGAYLPPVERTSVSSTSAEGASGFCQTMPPSGRQLMSIGASEHRAFVRAKARFAGQKAQEHISSVEMLLHRTYCHVSLVAFSGGKCRACLALPDVPASDLPALIHSRWLLPGPLRHPSLPGVSHFRCFRCYLDLPPALHGPLRHPSLPGVSLFRRFRCYLDRPPAPRGSLRHPPPPGVSLFRRFRCYLDLPPAPHGPLRLPSLPGVSLFWRFRCYLDRPPALRGPLRRPPPPV